MVSMVSMVSIISILDIGVVSIFFNSLLFALLFSLGTDLFLVVSSFGGQKISQGLPKSDSLVTLLRGTSGDLMWSM